MKSPSLILIMLLITTGCSLNNQTRENPTHTQSGSSNVSEKNSEDDEKEQFSTENSSYPYSVNIEDFIISDNMEGSHPVIINPATFISNGLNNPSKIVIDQGVPHSLGICAYIYSANVGSSEEQNRFVMYPITIENIPTKEISIFGGIGTDRKKRIVKVNTEMTLHSYESSENDKKGYSQLDGHKFYLFHNNQGTISLATENFSGNVDIEDIETMMEYIQE